MDRRRRWTLLLILAALIAGTASAETFAVSVRPDPRDDPSAGAGIPADLADSVAEVLADVEEGAMDVMFSGGHIVFDIDGGDVSLTSWFDALATARTGGARILIFIDVDCEELPGGRVRPQSAVVAAADVATARDHLIGRIDVSSLPDWDDQTPEALSMTLGNRAAESVLEAIREGKTPW